MRLRIDTGTQTITVEEAENLKQLDAITLGTGSLMGAKELSRVDGDHLWIKVASLRSLCGTQPDSWQQNFDKMIAYATSKGWVDASDGSVRVHIVAQGKS
jgi:hypothetical protein